MDEQPPALDWVGAILSLAAVGGTVAAIIEGPVRGWDDPVTLAVLTIGLVALVVFVDWERRIRVPMSSRRFPRRSPLHESMYRGYFGE